MGGFVCIDDDSFLTEEKVRTIYSYGNYLLAGLKDKGCYITLLNVIMQRI